jgi:hypothetical protein
MRGSNLRQDKYVLASWLLGDSLTNRRIEKSFLGSIKLFIPLSTYGPSILYSSIAESMFIELADYTIIGVYSIGCGTLSYKISNTQLRRFGVSHSSDRPGGGLITDPTLLNFNRGCERTYP